MQTKKKSPKELAIFPFQLFWYPLFPLSSVKHIDLTIPLVVKILSIWSAHLSRIAQLIVHPCWWKVLSWGLYLQHTWMLGTNTLFSMHATLNCNFWTMVKILRTRKSGQWEQHKQAFQRCTCHSYGSSALCITVSYVLIVLFQCSLFPKFLPFFRPGTNPGEQ